MTAGRVVGLGLLAIVAVLVAWILLKGDGEHTYRLRFETAGQLVKDNDVQIGGRRIGSVKEIQLTDNNQAEITIAVEEPYAPLHDGTTAQIRAAVVLRAVPDIWLPVKKRPPIDGSPRGRPRVV